MSELSLSAAVECAHSSDSCQWQPYRTYRAGRAARVCTICCPFSVLFRLPLPIGPFAIPCCDVTDELKNLKIYTTLYLCPNNEMLF